MNSPLAELGWTLVRLTFGLSLAWFHGYDKVFHGKAAGVAHIVAGMGWPAPFYLAWASSLVEFFGGLLIALGFVTRPAGLLVAVNMAVALYSMREAPGRWELALLYLVVAVMATLAGGGRYSLDRGLGLRSPLVRKGSLL